MMLTWAGSFGYEMYDEGVLPYLLCLDSLQSERDLTMVTVGSLFEQFGSFRS